MIYCVGDLLDWCWCDGSRGYCYDCCVVWYWLLVGLNGGLEWFDSCTSVVRF